ncbi:UvrD-helicase domain-containing protein [Chryseobacterium sp. 18068]|uniref:UvrD-helicase domain-containing protein n=1 Tax=Chryseobacterium sp. 18068 TaxID=2681414 RepID=UPI00135C8D92|nr:UvrD-helicase domain-containing protein [Chryseobacterium sp. 18068]
MVNKRLVLAVAGSGKTRHIIETLDLDKRFLIITYTNNNYNTLKKRVLTKFGYIPENIKILKFFDFLYSFCVKPFLLFEHKIKGINLDVTPEYTNYLKTSDYNRYLTKSKQLYHNRISKFLEITGVIPLVVQKLEKFYDWLIIDEFQDLGGHDFNLIMEVAKSKTNLLFVGDFHQNTFVTSHDGNVNKALYDNYQNYINKISLHKIEVDTTLLIESHRCSPTICNFISDNLGIEMKSKRFDETNIYIVENIEDIPEVISNNNIIKLVYRDSNKQAFFSKNWGECKGEDDYSDTCIILTKSATKSLSKRNLSTLPVSTKNKLYVALSRTRGDCYLVKQK